MSAERLAEASMASFQLPDGFSDSSAVLAMGGELKSSFCMLAGGEARLSQAGGDLEQAGVFRNYADQLEAGTSEVDGDFSPDCIAIDMHPDYLSAQMGERLADRYEIPVVRVQHHHAHIAATMAEHQHPLTAGPVLGIALDGLGFGADGSIWGGEFLLANYAESTRLGRFQPVAMPGGAQAVREPWRNALAHLYVCGWADVAGRFGDTDIVRFLQTKQLPVLQTMLDKSLNSPLASSAGRLFDAVAACLDIHREMLAHEAQAAIELERLASLSLNLKTVAYPFTIQTDQGLEQLEWSAMWLALLADLANGINREIIAARFHRTLIMAISELAESLCHTHGLNSVAISGGVFQNKLLRDGVKEQLSDCGLQVLMAEKAPPHDGGLALGQAVVAAANMMGERP